METELVEIGSDGYDPRVWINNALKTSENNSSLPVSHFASMLVAKLQMQFQEVCLGLDETTDTALDNIPRVLRDIETIRMEAKTLSQRLLVVREDIEKVESETAQSIECLSSIDRVKDRVENAENILHHVNCWNNITSDLERLNIDNSNFLDVAEKVGQLRYALEQLTIMPDFKERKTELLKYEANLQKIIVPVLVQAHADHDAGTLAKVVDVLKSSNKKDMIKQTFLTSKKGPALSAWAALNNATSVDSSASASPMGSPQPKAKRAQELKLLRQNISLFHEQLLKLLEHEGSWLVHIGGDNANSIQCTLLSEVLCEIKPSLYSLIESNENGILKTATIISQLNEQFCKNLSKMLPIKINNGIGVLNNNNNNNNTVENDEKDLLIPKLKGVIHSPFVPILINYEKIQNDIFKRFVTSTMKKIQNQGYTAMVESISESVEGLFNLFSISLEDCIQLTSGMAGFEFFKSIDVTMKDYVAEVKVVIKKMKSICEHKATSKNSNSSNQSYQTQDSSYFNGALQLLRTCGDLLQRLSELKNKGKQQLGKACMTSSKLKNTSLNEPCNYLLIEGCKQQRSALALAIQQLNDERENIFLIKSQIYVNDLNDFAHKLTFDLLFSSISNTLETVPALPCWKAGNVKNKMSLPSFSVSQQEYISQIGQRLLDLPQQLELFVCKNNDDETSLLHLALSNGSLPYIELTGEGRSDGNDDESHQANRWLEAIVVNTMYKYVEITLQLTQLSDLGATQLAVDIEYLFNILSVLDIQLLPELAHILKFCKTPKTDLISFVKETNKNTSLVTINQRLQKIRK